MESDNTFYNEEDNTDDDTFYDTKDESETDASSVKGKKKAVNKGQEKRWSTFLLSIHFLFPVIAIQMLLYVFVQPVLL